MARQIKQQSYARVIIFAIVLFIINQLSITDAATSIPAEASQVNSWLHGLIKPVTQRKGMDKDIVEAEAAKEVITVRADGRGKFKTITDALKSIKTGNKKRVIISIGPGEYKEKVTVERFKPYVTMIGDPKNMPVIVFDGTALKYGTVYSATLTVEADNFIGANLIIKNSAPRPDGKRKGAQAVAMRMSGDEGAFYNCRFIGFQDTVCDDRGKHFFKDCYIEGTVDFIFGEGRSIYLNCELHIVPGDIEAFITAHARKNAQGVGGYSFVHCKITGSGGNTVLGRPWMEAARVIFSFCTMSNVIKAEGWSDGKKPQLHKTIYFAEFNNNGPGAVKEKRASFVKHLTPTEAQQFISLEYIEAIRWLLPASIA